MRRKLLILLLTILLSPTALAQETADEGEPEKKPLKFLTAAEQIRLEDEKIDIAKDIENLKKELKDEWQDYAIAMLLAMDEDSEYDRHSLISPTRCFELARVPGAFLCISFKQEDQNNIFTRISAYSEGFGGLAPNQVHPFEANGIQLGLALVAGHDLRQEAIDGFYSTAVEGQHLMSYDELAFYDNVVQPIQARMDGEPYAVGTTSVQNHYRTSKVAIHEALHLQYYLNPELRDAVVKYWREKLTDEEREQAKNALRKVYNVDDEFVMTKEFMSYVLEPGGKTTGRLADIAKKHSDTLYTTLTEAGFVLAADPN